MRNISGISSIESSSSRRPCFKFTREEDLLNWDNYGADSHSYVSSGVFYDVPTRYRMDTTSSGLYRVWTGTSSALKQKLFDSSVDSDWGSSGSTGISSASCAMGDFDITGNSAVYTTINVGEGDSLMLGASTVVEHLPFSAIYTETRIYRVERVVTTALGYIIAVGDHRWYPTKHSTISFYFVPLNGSGCYELDTMLQFENADANATFSGTDYFGFNRRCALVDAIAVGDNKIFVMANSLIKTVGFFISIPNLIESEPFDIIQVDEYGAATQFYGISVAKVGSLYYMSARFVRKMDNGDQIGLDTLMSSSNCRNWSVGDINFVVDNSSTGVWGVLPHNMQSFYYVGNNTIHIAPLRAMDGGPAATDITDSIIEASYDSVSGNADAIQISMENATAASLLTTSIIRMFLGYAVTGSASSYGEIVMAQVDQAATPRKASGYTPAPVSLMDYGQRKLSTWRSPVDADMWSSIVLDNLCTGAGQMIYKTTLTDVTFDKSNGILSYGLNSPIIGYASVRDTKNSIDRLRVKFPSGQEDGYCTPYAGIVVGGADDATFNMITLSPDGRQGAWSTYGVQARKSTFAAPDPNDVTVGGFNITEGLTPMINGCMYDFLSNWTFCGAAATATAYSSSATGYSSTVALDAVYDLIVKTFGRKTYIYKRVADYTNASTAEAVMIGTINWGGGNVRHRGSGKEYVGLIVGTDVLATTTCPSALCTSAVESQLTYAYNSTSPSAWEYGSGNSQRRGGVVPNISVLPGPVFGRIVYADDTTGTMVMPRDIGRSNGVGFDTLSNFAFEAGSIITNPTDWRAHMTPGGVYVAMSTLTGNMDTRMNTTCCFKIGNEIVKARKITGTMHNGAAIEMWCVHTRYVFPASSTSADSTQVDNWHSGGDYPGDPIGLNPAPSIYDDNYLIGMDVSIKTRNYSIATSNAESLYIVSQTAGTPNGYQAFLNRGVSLTGPSGSVPGDMLAVTGRGFYGTSHLTHDSDEIMTYYPLYSPGNSGSPTLEPPITQLVNVRRFEHYMGRYNSTEDDIRACSAMAGVHNTSFRGMVDTDGNHWKDRAINITSSWLDTHLSLSDFTMSVTTDIGTASSGGVLKIRFRSEGSSPAYQLEIAKSGAALFAYLEAPNSSITAYGGRKWLEWVQLSDGSEYGSGSREFRLIVRNNIVKLEMEGQLLWVWNLESMGYNVQVAGNIFISGASMAVTDYVTIHELGDEVEDHVLDINSTGSDAVSFITNERHILPRSIPGGGVEFSRFLYRDDLGSYSENLFEDTPQVKVSDVRGHVQVSGAVFGEYVDMDFIRRNGYGFMQSNNRLLNSVADSVYEARYLIRLAKEQMSIRQIKGAAFLNWQPEDKLSLSYSSLGDTPLLAAANWVVTRASYQMAAGILNGAYDIRSYQTL